MHLVLAGDMSEPPGVYIFLISIDGEVELAMSLYSRLDSLASFVK